MPELVIRRGLEEPDTASAFTPHRPARPEKAEGGKPFELVSEYEPAGDQPTAIRELVEGISENGEASQVLLGVTGSGKTFTMAKVIETLQRPALVIAPNKILAAQLYGEFKSFFPNNAVEYFVSYYDYYQPEAYVPRTDTYIEKESSVNEAIDRMRHSATRSLLERDDVIIVASVSCLYGIGSVETYSAMTFSLKKGASEDQREVIRKLVALQYRRNDQAFARGNFRVRGDSLEIFPSHYEDMAWRISFFGDEIEDITEFDPLTGKTIASLDYIKVYANSHYVTPGPTLKQAMEAIKHELAERLKELTAEGRLLEAQRLEQASKITRASSPDAYPASRRRPFSNIFPTTRFCSSTRATRRCRRSVRWRAAITAGKSRLQNMGSACRAASTTGRSASTNGTRCDRRRHSSRRRPDRGK
jgi:excinuclease ABC subunit B